MPETVGKWPSDAEFVEEAQVTWQFSFLPRRCSVTGQSLWMTHAYRARRMWTGPGESVIEDRWYSATEYIILRLKHA